MADRQGATMRGRWPSWVVDTLIGVSVAAIVSFVISADVGGRQSPDAIAYLWAVGLGALMLARRRYPLVVLAVTALGLFAYYAAGYPAIGLAVPVAAALFSAAEFGHLLASVVTAAAVTVVSVAFRLIEGQDVSLVVGYELAGHVVLMAAAIALGDSLRSRRAAQAGARRIAELTAHQVQQAADARIHAERIAIARDLHDSMGHSASVVFLYTDVAREAIGRDDAAVREALDLITGTTTTTMEELRRTVSLLRGPGERDRTVISLSGIRSLADVAIAAGFDVETTVPTRAMPPLVDAAAFRIVQEAVTNVVRHSAGTRLEITVTNDDRAVYVSVLDDGPTSAAHGRPSTDSHGIRGMRERAESLGGCLTAAFEPTGFAVRAELPMDGAT